MKQTYSIITKKDDLPKDDLLSNKKGVKGEILSITSKICKRITRLSQPQQQTRHANIQKEEIEMSMNLTYFKDTSKNSGSYSDLRK